MRAPSEDTGRSRIGACHLIAMAHEGHSLTMLSRIAQALHCKIEIDLIGA